MAVTNRIRALRVERGITQKRLSEDLGVRQNTLSTWETGRYEPDNEMLRKIANYFNVSVDYLVGNIPADIPTPAIGFLGILRLTRLIEQLSEEQGKELTEIAQKMVESGGADASEIDVYNPRSTQGSEADVALLRAYHAADDRAREIVDVALRPFMEKKESAAG